MKNEILFVDKPKGITSFDCIRILRKKLGIKKMGHAGTLDPMASGLMIIGVNEGTKRMSEFLKLPKIYVAEIRLGERTDTGDLEGRVVEEAPVPEIPEEKMQATISGLVGTHSLPVPMYSAVKVGGRPLYKLARKKEKGAPLSKEEESIVPPAKDMTVLSVKLLRVEGNTITIEMEVSSGTYIRALAEEFGRRLGVPATLSGLRRTKIGNFLIENAVKVEP